jgi:hypothetical protein
LPSKEISPFAACFVTRGHLENRAGRKHAFQAPFRFYGNDGTKFPKNCPTVGLTSITVIACASFEVQKGSQLFLRTHNETLSVVAMRVSNPDRSPVGINR